MSLSLALNNALTGLSVNQRVMSVISHNIANANTEGYTRQVADLRNINYEGIGSGVSIVDINRKVDLFLEKSIQIQTAFVGRSSALEDYMNRIQILMGNPGEDNSLDAYTELFFNRLQNLAETPDSVAMKENAVDSGIVLAREISTLAEGLEQLRFEADLDIVDSINTLNLELRNLDNLNTAIIRANALGNPTADIEDQQALAIKRIAQFVDIETFLQDSGAIHLHTGEGNVILDDFLHEISYSRVDDVQALIDGEDIMPITIQRLNDNGTPTGTPIELASGGPSGTITTFLEQGKIKGLMELRDNFVPAILSQLDEFAATLRDTFNAIHNNGSSYPGTNELTGTRLVGAADVSTWTGDVRIAVLDETGRPVNSAYPQGERDTGYRPFNLDLDFLDSGYGAGRPDIQTIIDEINNYFDPPPVKTQVGNLANIQMVSTIDTLPGSAPATFSFDFDLENIDRYDSKFYVTDIQVFDNTAANITNVTNQPPRIALNNPNTFTTVAGSRTVVVNASNHGLIGGERIYMSLPAAAIDGIPAAAFNQFFEISNVSANTFEITVNTPAVAGGNFTEPNMFITPPWDTIAAGEKARIRDAGTVSVDLSGNANSTFYDIVVNVSVDDRQGIPGAVPSAQVTYRVFNNTVNLLNDRYSSTAITGNGTREVPNTDQPYLRALLVDENGVEIAKSNGEYLIDRTGYLRLQTNDPLHTVAVDELTSKENGLDKSFATAVTPERNATNRAFSHYFELNNFFESNQPTDTGDTLKNSAIELAVEQRFEDDASLISLGNLTRSNQPADPTKDPLYTYERFISDNNVIQAMAKLGLTSVEFDPSGGLTRTRQTFAGYMGQILAYNSATTARLEGENRDSTILLEGFTERADTFSGVNIDEEMANTVTFQHAYTASARIVTVTNQLFDDLLGMVA